MMKSFSASHARRLMIENEDQRQTELIIQYNQWLEEVFSNIDSQAKQGKHTLIFRRPPVRESELQKLFESLGYMCEIPKSKTFKNITISWFE